VVRPPQWQGGCRARWIHFAFQFLQILTDYPRRFSRDNCLNSPGCLKKTHTWSPVSRVRNPSGRGGSTATSSQIERVRVAAVHAMQGGYLKASGPINTACFLCSSSECMPKLDSNFVRRSCLPRSVAWPSRWRGLARRCVAEFAMRRSRCDAEADAEFHVTRRRP
jgi:hypothetical protein